MVLPQTAINVLPEATFSLSDQRIVVVAPHCDDEVLGAGGLIQKAIKSGSDVRVVMVTDCNYQKIGQTRQGETKSALGVLGLPSNKIIFLNFPEKAEKSKKNIGENVEMRAAMKTQFVKFDPTLVVLPHPEDTHIDHATSGREGLKALKENNSSAKVAYYLIHYNFLRYPNPSGLHLDKYLLPPARLISWTDRWYKLDLTAEGEDLKEEAVLTYRSQLRRSNPILYKILLDFIRRNELFMVEGTQ